MKSLDSPSGPGLTHKGPWLVLTVAGTIENISISTQGGEDWRGDGEPGGGLFGAELGWNLLSDVWAWEFSLRKHEPWSGTNTGGESSVQPPTEEGPVREAAQPDTQSSLGCCIRAPGLLHL